MTPMPRLLTPQHELPAAPVFGEVTVRARAVTVRRRGAAGGRPVLTEVDFAAAAGELVALVGPNGAGKSTLLAVLAAELAPTAGQVELAGQPLRHWSLADMARRRAVLPQNHPMGFGFTAADVVRMGRAPWRGTRAAHADQQKVHAAMAATDVLDLAARSFPTLSGGEQARVALARILAQDTTTLLLDEPTAALDVGHAEAVLTLAAGRAAAGDAVVMVVHDLGTAAAYADRVAVLDAGRVVADGPPREVLTTDLLSQVYQYPVEVFDHPVTGGQVVLPARDGVSATAVSARPESTACG